VTDVFDLQDDITRGVAASTQTHVLLEEGSRAEQAEKPDLNVWLLIKRSWRKLYDLAGEALAEARRLAEKAVELAPQSGAAHEILSIVLAHQSFMLTVADERATLLEARDEAVKAARLQRPSEHTYWALGMVQFFLSEHHQAVLSLRRGLDINPNCVVIHSAIGNFLALMGRADESIIATEFAMRADPRDPSIFSRYQALADTYFVKRDLEKMLEWAAKAVALKPDYFAGHLRVIVSLALLGRNDELASAVARYVRDVPDDVRSRFHTGGFVRGEDRALFAEGLRIADLRE
jgi:adenylate cyclase